jgi:hypothetical protein
MKQNNETKTKNLRREKHGATNSKRRNTIETKGTPEQNDNI